jgi:hypothetical protein
MRADGESLMSLIGKLAVFAFLFLLTGLAVTWASPASGSSQVVPTQLTQDQEKLCLNCHSPRDPPNDTTHVHTGQYALMQEGAPCWLCHTDYTPSDDLPEPVHNPANEYHPTEAEATAMGKDLMDCTECHYPHDIQAELASGTIQARPANVSGPTGSGVAPPFMVWAPMIGAGVSLITGISMIAVVFSARKRSVAKGGT